ncbi:MAG: hypothetical protein SGARI_007643, partial [Bacillariaceae sp.]
MEGSNGRLYVVEHNEPSSEDDDDGQNSTDDDDDVNVDQQKIAGLFGGGKIVYKSPVAPHRFELLEISFVPKPLSVHSKSKLTYHLWHVVGGGGEHSLHFENLYVHTLVLDDTHRSMQKAYASLIPLKILRREGEEEEEEEDEESDNVTAAGSYIFCAQLLQCLALALCEQSSSNGAVQNCTYDSKVHMLFEQCHFPTDPLSLSAIAATCDFELMYLCQNPSRQMISYNANSVPDETNPSEIILSKSPLHIGLLRKFNRTLVPITRVPFLVGITKQVRISGKLGQLANCR